MSYNHVLYSVAVLFKSSCYLITSVIYYYYYFQNSFIGLSHKSKTCQLGSTAYCRHENFQEKSRNFCFFVSNCIDFPPFQAFWAFLARFPAYLLKVIRMPDIAIKKVETRLSPAMEYWSKFYKITNALFCLFLAYVCL